MRIFRLYDANCVLRIFFESDQKLSDLIQLHFPTPSIWVFDGPGSLTARREILPSYKTKRDRATPKADGFFDFLDAVRTELLPHTNAIVMRAKGFEADDVIAQLVKGNPQDRFIIDSTDGDFQALADSDGRVVTTSNGGKKLQGVLGKDIRLFKTLVGDSSDDIPGISGFGPKAWEALDEQLKRDWTMALNFPIMADADVLGALAERSKLGKTSKEWLLAKGGFDLLVIYWKVVDFLPVPGPVMDGAMESNGGAVNPAAYQATIAKYLWS